MSSQAVVPRRKQSRTDSSPSSTQPPSHTSDTEAVKESTDKLLDDIDRLLDQDAVENLKEQLKDHDPTVEKPLTLSQLMREGASVTDQAIGQWVKPTGETCALSAAMLAARARGLA